MPPRTAKQKRVAVSTAMVHQMATAMKMQNRVWVGRGRRPVDETRPTLVQELCRVTGLTRSAIHRILARKPRGGTRRRAKTPSTGPVDHGSVMSSGLAKAMAAAMEKPSASVGGKIVAQNVAHLPVQPTKTPQVQNPQTITTTTEKVKPPYSGLEPLPDVDPGKSRGLEAIGLRSRPEASGATRVVPPVHQQARRALDDGIEWYLSVCTPPLDIRNELIAIQRRIHQLNRN